MRAIDTNVLVRLIARDHPGQAAIAESFIKNGAWVSTLALAEAAWVLNSVYRLSPAALVKAIEMLLDLPNVVLQDADAVGEALDLYRTKPSLGFSDCLIVRLASKAGHLPLGTFDRNLARVPGTERL